MADAIILLKISRWTSLKNRITKSKTIEHVIPTITRSVSVTVRIFPHKNLNPSLFEPGISGRRRKDSPSDEEKIIPRDVSALISPLSETGPRIPATIKQKINDETTGFIFKRIPARAPAKAA